MESVLELCRIAPDVRMFPLLSLDRSLSRHLGPVMAAAERNGLRAEIVVVDYELQKGGNKMLRITRT
ncbi:MAG: hypothetical protein ACK4UN_12145 [Limisphaerales bacterium]